MDIRQRKLKQDYSGSPTSPKRLITYGPSRSHRRCLFYSAIVFTLSTVIAYLLLILSSSHKTGSLDSIALAVGLHKRIYTVVIDAGSTGSRVLASCLHESVVDGSFKLEGDLFVEQSPGLSAFANNPKRGAEKISELLEEAKRFVPREAWSQTNLVLRATAGLRLLPEGQSASILDEVEHLFEMSPFHTTANSVAIMEGSDEGLFAWVNVNFLLDKFFGNPSKMVAALDLGGGSTQITFPLMTDAHLSQFPPSDVQSMNMFGQKINVYSHSYLGLGLMAGRHAILTAGNPSGSSGLASECVNPINNNKTFKYGGKEYLVSGPKNPEITKKKRKDTERGYVEIPVVRLKECTELARMYINSLNVTKPIGILDFEVVAFSYFFDRATEVGLVDPFTGGLVYFRDLKKATVDSCLDPNVDRPFMCVDLVFITSLLEEGYGFHPDTQIKIVKQIDGHEVSWSLGAAFHFLLNGL